jgi:solute:Na+ symporter, SSS family
MQVSENRKLSIISLATLLVSAHYGLGFLLGTAERAMSSGVMGSLYAVSVGVGTIASLALARFYWTQIEQIWTLLGNRYGNLVKVGVGLMSWMSFIGIGAVQIIATASILAVMGIAKLPTMVTVTLLFWVFSLLAVEKVSWLLRGLLLLNILGLFYALWVLHGIPNYVYAPWEFVVSLPQINLAEVIGVSLSTILLVIIDMKCHQYMVQALDLRTVYLGCILAAIAIIALAFLPSAVVIAAQNSGILPANLDAKEVVPYILSWVGHGTNQPLGIFLIGVLAVPSLGLGSSVLRVQTKTMLDLQIVPKFQGQNVLIASINALFALAIALKGGEIIGLILLFYTAYLSAVWVPWIAYLLNHGKLYTFSDFSVRLSLVVGSLSALITLSTILYQPKAVFWENGELTIMIFGIGCGSISLLFAQLAEKFASISAFKVKG